VKIRIWEDNCYQEAGKSAWGVLGQASQSSIWPIEHAAQTVTGINPKSACLPEILMQKERLTLL